MTTLQSQMRRRTASSDSRFHCPRKSRGSGTPRLVIAGNASILRQTSMLVPFEGEGCLGTLRRKYAPGRLVKDPNGSKVCRRQSCRSASPASRCRDIELRTDTLTCHCRFRRLGDGHVRPDTPVQPAPKVQSVVGFTLPSSASA